MRHKVVTATPEQLQKSLLARDYVPVRKKKAPKVSPKNFVGHTIVEIRTMTPEEMAAEGWDESRRRTPLAVVLSNGTRIYASRDDEGNGPGAFFVRTAGGDGLYMQREK